MAKDWAATIQGLLAMADDSALSEDARANYREKAEELMIRYRIDQETMIAQGAGDAPIMMMIRVTTGGQSGHLISYYTSAFRSIARHCGIRYVTRWDSGYVAHAVGYEGDVRYAEFLWTSALLMFSTRINPRWDAALSFEENVYRLRASGRTRKEIAFAAGMDGTDPKVRSKIQRVYLAGCQARNERPLAAGLGHQADVFQQAYADQFVDTLRYRLLVARDAADSVAGGVVLHGRSDRVDEAFYTRFPDERPKPPTKYVAPDPCERCAKAKSGRCRKHTYAVDRRHERRWNAVENSPGRAAGHAAAEGVLIERGHTRAQRVTGWDGDREIQN